MAYIKILLFLFFCFNTSFSEEFLDQNEIVPIVTTPLGRVQGFLSSSRKGRWFYSFLGIKYADANRLEAATLSKPWSGIYDGRKEGPMCPQQDPQNNGEIMGTEDCLYLNVYVPSEERCGDNKLPVIANIHGGGMGGSATMGGKFGSEYLLDECIVFVTMNYRFGALGFLTTVDGLIPGNLGLKDQVTSLEWIKLNIESFRGDPNLVTIMGISFGGMSVGHHLASPLAKGLFHRAIIQSGSAFMPFALSEDPGAMARRVGEGLNCSMESSASLKSCLIDSSVEDILTWQCPQPWCAFRDFSMPVIEPNSTEYFYQNENPANRFRRGDFNLVPVIAGFQQDEGLGYALSALLTQQDVVNQLNSDWDNLAPGYLLYNNLNIPEDQVKIISQQIRQFYFGTQNISMETLSGFSHLFADRFFVQGIFEMVELVSKFVAVHTYVMTYKGGDSGLQGYGLGYDLPAATHGADGQFLFNDVDVIGFGKVGTEQREFSERFVKHWANFALTGEIVNDSGESTWNVTTGRANSFWHKLDLPEGNYENYLEDRRTFWENLPLYAYELN